MPLPVLALLLAVVVTALPGADLAEVQFDGLPAEVTPEAITAQATLKQGAAYDKAKLPAERARMTAFLQDLGYLDAEVRATEGFVPAGIRLKYAVKTRGVFTIEAVRIAGQGDEQVQALLAGLKVPPDAPCTQALLDRLCEPVAKQMGINVLFVAVDKKLNAGKKSVVVTFGK
jgi:outer membrane protein assembly factor BamA